MRTLSRTTFSLFALVVFSGSIAFAGTDLALAAPAIKQETRVVDFDPQPGTHVSLEPSRVTIAFDDTISPSKATIVVRNSGGSDVTNGVFTVEANNIYANLPYPLKPDTYSVHYRVQDRDGTPFGGNFQFAWEKPNASPKALTTWREAANIPPIVALPEDSPSSPAADDADHADDAESPDSADSPTAAPDSDHSTTDAAESSSSLPLIFASVGALLVLLILFAIWRMRRSQNSAK